jgi:ATP-dependent DNA helicase RecQ
MISPSLDQAQSAMQRHWGHASFRPGQDAAIEAALDGQDVLAIMPTGGGKSICYQVPALLLDGLTIVVSPLIALMHDQVAGLRARGIEAAFIDSTLRHHEVDQRWTNAEHGQYDLLYVAPERLESELFLARAGRLDVALLAVDEAHCVSQWGHHFRPSYLRIPEARAELGGPPTIAVTATATPAVRRDIETHLALDDLVRVIRGFDRPNLVWSVFETDNKRSKVRDVLRTVDGSGILYAATRRDVETWTQQLNAAGEAAVGYHAGMSAEARGDAQAAWVDGAARLIVATNAFGMGIDKPDVRFVIHLAPPSSLEAYYQEAGRAGRDGHRAYAVLLYHASDASTQEALIETSHPSAAETQSVYDAVCNIGQVPLGVQPEVPVLVNMDAVVRVTGLTRGKIRTALELLERHEAWQVMPRHKHYGFIRFEQSAGATRRYAENQSNRALGRFIRTLLRTVHADAFNGWWRMDVRQLTRRTGVGRERLLRGLAFLGEQDLIQWRPPGTARQVLLTVPRSRAFPVDDQAVQQARQRAERRLDHMLRYAQSVTCRRHFLLAYFGEVFAPPCGACDVCLGRHRPPSITPSDESVLRRILQHVAENKDGRAWMDSGPAAPPPHRRRALVDWLVQEGYLRLLDPLEETFEVTEQGQHLMAQWTPTGPSD